MQELTAPPQMASPYMSAGSSNAPPGATQPPRLGTPIPGTTGGLPAKPGLTVFDNPMPQQLQSQPQQTAQQLQQYGRGQDSMLIHMTPDEVNSLRGLAQRFGGDLSVNPNTGLPEAGFLGKILPTLAGILGTMVGIPPVWLFAGGTAAGTIATGDLGKGLMAGLGAYGGAGLGGALGLGGKLSGNLFGALGNKAADVTAKEVGKQALTTGGAKVASAVPDINNLNTLTSSGAKVATQGLSQQLGQIPTSLAPGKIGTGVAPEGFLDKFKAATNIKGLGNLGAAAAGIGALSGLSGTPKSVNDKGVVDNSYEGPYYAQPRTASFAPSTDDILSSSKERDYFDVDMPEIYNTSGAVVQPGSSTAPGTMIRQMAINPNAKKGQMMYNPVERPYMMAAAKGGEVPDFSMQSGGHVFPAKAVAAYGNFDTEAGQRRLAGLGGIPIKGPGDGVSDSIPATIDGKTPARVASGEVYFPPKVVERLGGTKKLYAMMRNAEKAANRAKSGERVKGLA